MNDVPAPRRALCAHCQRPLRSCLCQWIMPTINCVPLRVLQHPLERRHAKGSLPLLRLSLSQCTVQVAEVFSAEEQARWQQPGTWLLYPRDDTAAHQATSVLRTAVFASGAAQRLMCLKRLSMQFGNCCCLMAPGARHAS